MSDCTGFVVVVLHARASSVLGIDTKVCDFSNLTELTVVRELVDLDWDRLAFIAGVPKVTDGLSSVAFF